MMFSGIVASLALVPAFAAAQGLQQTLGVISSLLNGLIGLLITLAIVVFFWGLVKYLLNMSNENAKEGIQMMIWGVAAIFVMVSIWGLIRLLQTTFSVNNADPASMVPKGVAPAIR
jgi:hypothetical protein